MTKLALTVKEASEISGISVDMLYHMCRNNLIPHKRLYSGRKLKHKRKPRKVGRVIFPRKAFEEWLNEVEPIREKRKTTRAGDR